MFTELCRESPALGFLQDDVMIAVVELLVVVAQRYPDRHPLARLSDREYPAAGVLRTA